MPKRPNLTLEDCRQHAIDWVTESDGACMIHFGAWPEESDGRFLDDVYDGDGDSIVVTARYIFELDGQGLVQALISQGTSPQYAAMVLRKYADMLDGPRGLELLNMSQNGDDPNNARFDESGYLHIYNHRKLMEKLDREERGEGADED